MGEGAHREGDRKTERERERGREAGRDIKCVCEWGGGEGLQCFE